MGRLALAAMAGLCFAGSAAAQSGYEDWAAVVVAADYRGGGGAPIENFDNARRDVVSALQQIGFQSQNIAQLSVVAEEDGVGRTNIQELAQRAGEVTGRARGGCLFYVTSHGSPQGVVFGEDVMPPEALAQGLDQWCGGRPTVVVVSACFSGVFVPVLASDERMVLTAARPDRSSFGCSAGSRYPYFDQCVLESLPTTQDFPSMGQAAQACVSQREEAEGLSPASGPQLSVGSAVGPVLQRLSFPAGRTSTSQAEAPAAANDNAKPPEGEVEEPSYEAPAASAGGKS